MTWETVPLRSVARVDAVHVAPEAISTSDVYVGLEHIGRNGAIDETYYPAAREIKSSKNRFDGRHILYGKLRPNLAKVARPRERGVCSTDIYPILPGSSVDRAYLAHFLLSPEAVGFAAARTAGVNLPRVSWSALGELPIPLPPLAEQRRIAAILDEADALRLTAICRLRLFQKLEESAFELVLAASTDSVPLGSVVRLITGPFGSSVHKEDYVTGGIPLVNPSHILAGEVAVDPRVAVSKGKADQLSAFFLREGDVVLGRRGEMGRAAVVRKADLPALCGTGTMILRSPDHSPIGSFLARVLRTPRFVSVLAAAASGVTMPNLSQSAVADIRIPRPSAAVESRVAAFDRDMASARQQVVVATQQLDSLFASLQHRAFRGEL
ncbi:restriction endonuclease subunit S [uncultured Microbacterium sp.]|uniref:restriction endonuclease subunit S n=1 Tax=uncultured Microbacterium sp. TaxID=191216 RepID=UPI0025987CF2|nr:restriction endonuclease subunit S [uncultured Microbacterium sp.]